MNRVRTDITATQITKAKRALEKNLCGKNECSYCPAHRACAVLNELEDDLNAASVGAKRTSRANEGIARFGAALVGAISKPGDAIAISRSEAGKVDKVKICIGNRCIDALVSPSGDLAAPYSWLMPGMKLADIASWIEEIADSEAPA